jgi:hypothetical protein
MKIKKIEKKSFKGNIYNLELQSNENKDDLFWIEGNTNIITHNCLPKDLNALIYEFEQSNIDATVLNAVWDKNLKVRKK